MSTKAVIPVFHSVEDANMTTQVVSRVTDVSTVDNIGIQITFTGSPVGDFFIEGSVNNTTWIPLEFTVAPVAVGVGDDFLFNIKQFPYPKIRIRYTPTSGTGVLNAWVFAKRLGG